jgi:5-methylcytosine-specific restriction endonuclease McrA
LEKIKNSESKSAICKTLRCKPETLERYLKIMDIEYKGNQGLKGIKVSNKRKNTLEYLKNEFISTPRLRKKLIQDGMKNHKCEMCGIENWLGKDITLELHHIDGNRFNNDLSNLQILCPNCHSLTPNHGKKKPS